MNSSIARRTSHCVEVGAAVDREHKSGARMTSRTNALRALLLLGMAIVSGCAPLSRQRDYAQTTIPRDPYTYLGDPNASSNAPEHSSENPAVASVQTPAASPLTTPSNRLPAAASPSATGESATNSHGGPYGVGSYDGSYGSGSYENGSYGDSNSTPSVTIRGQTPMQPYPLTPAAPYTGTGYRSGYGGGEGGEGASANSTAQYEVAPAISASGHVQPVQFSAQGPTNLFQPPPPAGLIPGVTDPAGLLSPNAPTVPLNINVAETRTGRFSFGAGVNSDLGVTGQISIDERNFDIWRPPRSWDDLWSGRAWRGGGQGLRIEAMPGSQVQRYMASLTEPYLFDTNVSLTLSGYFFDRRYDDWDEQRLGGRVGLGYRLTPDLSVSAAVRAENVNIHDATVLVPELAEALGDNSLFSGRFTVAHDTRDTPFFPTEGHYIELGYEQVFGSFDYPRFNAELRKYFLLNQRPDGSGRHTMAYSFRLGMSGDEQPIYENYFAGGFSTMRGFDFRGASPMDGTVQVGGAFQFLGTMEYLFPLTADDMVKGVLFVDFGTVEEKIKIEPNDYRVSPGFGLRIAIPALGPAPLALDFAIPVAREGTDDIQNFSFYFGMGRN